METIEHVFFDLDRTLWDFETNSEATLKELFAEFALTEKLGVPDHDFIREYKRINEIFWEDYRNGVIGKEELRYARFEAAMKFFGHADRKLASDIGEAYIWRSPRKTALVDGAMEVLEYLRPKYQLHIITNGFDEVQHLKMSSTGLSPYFTHIITSESAGAKKPSPIIFEHALRLAGALPQNSLMVGDHLEADVQGAMAAGWRAAVLYDPALPRMAETDLIHIQHLSELKGLL